MTADVQIASYLATLRAHLAPLGSVEQEEIIREITAHIRDSAEKSGAGIDEVLLRLGSPERLAAQYREGALIGRASQSFSPVVLLRAALRFSARGLFGILVSVVGFFGYFLGGGLLFFGLLAPVWALTHRGFQARPFASILGIVAILGSSCVVLLITTFIMRASLRVILRWQTSFPGSRRA